MKLNIRKLEVSDWSTLVKWWDSWPEWVAPPKTFLPENGTGGLIVEKDKQPIVAGFLYFTNSQAVLLEWIISNPEYREDDRDMAITCFINTVEMIIKEWGYKYITEKRRKFLVEYLQGEINTYDQYLRGEIYWYAIDNPEGEEISSCGGFYGYDYMLEDAKSTVDYYHEHTPRQLELTI